MVQVNKAVASHRRHRKIIKRAKGYRGARSRTFKVAAQAVRRAEQYAYRDRRQRKREFRRLWILRLNAACRRHGINYSRFIHSLKDAGIELDRKVLSRMAMEEPTAFETLLKRIATTAS